MAVNPHHAKIKIKKDTSTPHDVYLSDAFLKHSEKNSKHWHAKFKSCEQGIWSTKSKHSGQQSKKMPNFYNNSLCGRV